MKNNKNKITKVFKALSDANRLSILEETCAIGNKCSAGEESCVPGSCVKNITEDSGLSKSTISHHLKTLIDADLISTKKEGKYVLCEVNEDMLDELIKYINSIKKRTNL
jgi:ArsR family transcriptional regulator, arsenate/arsenite/antimonite-responsive transcriptional repressor